MVIKILSLFFFLRLTFTEWKLYVLNILFFCSSPKMVTTISNINYKQNNMSGSLLSILCVKWTDLLLLTVP